MSLLPFLDVFSHIIDKIIPDPAQRAQVQLQLAQLADQEAQRDHDEAMGQMEVNKVEAASGSLFVAGWRPFIGWGCGTSLIYSTILAPMFHLGVPDLSFLQTVLMAMLGIGGMRTYEKVKGVATGDLTTKNADPAPAAESTDTPPKKHKGLLPFDIPGIGRL